MRSKVAATPRCCMPCPKYVLECRASSGDKCWMVEIPGRVSKRFELESAYRLVTTELNGEFERGDCT